MTPDWRTLPPLSALRAFDATARHGGFTGAGRALNVTHVAVAQQVRALEKDLGLPLVERIGRAVSLTEAGARLARALDDGFSAIATGVDDLRRSERQQGLRIATTVFTAQAVILPRLPEFWAMYPGVEVSLTPGIETVDILKDGYDLAIRGEATTRPGTEVIPLATSRFLVVGAPSLLGEGPVDAQALPWIASPGNDLDQVALRAAGLDPEGFARVSVGSPHLEVQAMLAGLGLGVSTEIIIRRELADGRLREVPFAGLPLLTYSAVVPKAPRRAAIDQFLSWLKSIF